jgi:ABC-type nickel/cobalt efflux system permease component RcnA
MHLVRNLTRSPGLIGFALLALIVWLAAGPLYSSYVQFLGWVYAEVRNFHQILTDSVGSLADNTTFATSFTLIFSSFVYGVLHAAGPGHGKVILSTYLLSQPEKIKKSIGLAALSSLTQGIVAILLVYGLFFLFGLAARDTKIAVAWSERLAFALVTLIGVVLIWRGLKAAYQAHKATVYDTHHHGHGHDHAHHDHDHHHEDGAVCSTCGHAHMPTNQQVDNATDWRTTLGVVFSIGLRPCTGAVLVLIFARYAGVSWAGVLAVLAMSLGTALTVSGLAITSVGARNFALRLLGSSNNWGDRLGAYVAILGGGVLALMGVGLYISSLAPPVRSMGL